MGMARVCVGESTWKSEIVNHGLKRASTAEARLPSSFLSTFSISLVASAEQSMPQLGSGNSSGVPIVSAGLLKGLKPNRLSYITTPNAQMSPFTPQHSPWYTSGGMYPMVPTTFPSRHSQSPA